MMLIRLFQSVILFVALSVSVGATDRTFCFVPQPANASPPPVPESAVFPDEAFGQPNVSWQAYINLWKAHHGAPKNEAIRRYLGLSLTSAVEIKSKRGRTVPKLLAWQPGQYQQVDSRHFTIYSRADRDTSERVAHDLENCYWIWTQLYFPLWEGSAQVTATLGNVSGDQGIADFLQRKRSRLSVARKLRVVLFRDAAEYQKTLASQQPGIARSTGYYSDALRTTFLYASAAGEEEDLATRRHEVTHQLFREATRSRLGRGMPGEASEFWLIEGIAGYMESLFVTDQFATVGGWDSPRLQFARYRMLSGGDSMQLAELRADGRLAVQKRADLARWYAHAIAQTHCLMDAGDAARRRWLYQQLADQYEIQVDLDSCEEPTDPERSLKSFLSIDDHHLKSNPPLGPIQQLCLAGCEVTAEGLSAIGQQTKLRWLDLSRLPIGNDAVKRLAPEPESLAQLNLEQTRIDSELSTWIGKAPNLEELDLSFTAADDSVIEALSVASRLTTLWLTQSQVTDQSIPLILNLKNLNAVDLQRTKVTESGLEKIRSIRPTLRLNPIELRHE